MNWYYTINQPAPRGWWGYHYYLSWDKILKCVAKDDNWEPHNFPFDSLQPRRRRPIQGAGSFG